MIVGAVALESRVLDGVRHIAEESGSTLRVWSSAVYEEGTAVKGFLSAKDEAYLSDKDSLLARSDVLVIGVNGIESLSFLFGALRRMVEGAGAEHVLLVSSLNVLSLLAMGEPEERAAVESFLGEGRLLVFDPDADWMPHLSSLLAV